MRPLSGLGIAAAILLATPFANGQQLQSVKDCVVGRKVVNNAGRKAVITKVDTAWSYCTVRFEDTGKEESMLYSLLRLDKGSVADLQAGSGQQLQSVKDCAVGRRVVNNGGRKGTITKVDLAWSYCTVRFDDTGKEESMLYSLLRAEGGGGGGLKLAMGAYECVNNGKPTDMLLRITGADTYSEGGRSGRFRMESNGKIVFESGPLAGQFQSSLLSEGRIGLNTDGGRYYPISCELNRNLR